MVFVVVAAIALVSLMIAAFFPAGRARDLAHTQALDERDPPAENRPT